MEYTDIIENSKTVAIVGISDNPERPSFKVAKYLSRFYRIIPVNPRLKNWEGVECYASLKDVPGRIVVDIADVFRRSSEVTPVAREAVERGVKLLWMQLGVINEEARAIAERAGVKVVMDRCLLVEHRRLGRDRPQPGA